MLLTKASTAVLLGTRRIPCIELMALSSTPTVLSICLNLSLFLARYAAAGDSTAAANCNACEDVLHQL